MKLIITVIASILFIQSIYGVDPAQSHTLVMKTSGGPTSAGGAAFGVGTETKPNIPLCNGEDVVINANAINHPLVITGSYQTISGTVGPGNTFTIRPTGNLAYDCSSHPGMGSTMNVVTPSSTPGCLGYDATTTTTGGTDPDPTTTTGNTNEGSTTGTTTESSTGSTNGSTTPGTGSNTGVLIGVGAGVAVLGVGGFMLATRNSASTDVGGYTAAGSKGNMLSSSTNGSSQPGRSRKGSTGSGARGRSASKSTKSRKSSKSRTSSAGRRSAGRRSNGRKGSQGRRSRSPSQKGKSPSRR